MLDNKNPKNMLKVQNFNEYSLKKSSVLIVSKTFTKGLTKDLFIIKLLIIILRVMNSLDIKIDV